MPYPFESEAFRKDPFQFADPKYVSDLLTGMRSDVEFACNAVKRQRPTDPNAYGGYSKKLIVVLAVGRERLEPYRAVIIDMVREHLRIARQEQWYGLCDVLAWSASWLRDTASAKEIQAFLRDIHRSDNYGEWAMEAMARLGPGDCDEERLLAIILDKEMGDRLAYNAARALRMCAPERGAERLILELHKCDGGKYDLVADKLRTCLLVIGSRKARKAASRSLLDRILLRKKWMRGDRDLIKELAGDYDPDSMVSYTKKYGRPPYG